MPEITAKRTEIWKNYFYIQFFESSVTTDSDLGNLKTG